MHRVRPTINLTAAAQSAKKQGATQMIAARAEVAR